jgi:cell division protein FtsN
MRHLNRQQGGTVVGIIIGLVIGLGIALTVAVVINKTPMPFTDRGSRVKAGVPNASQNIDPNRPLYGNRTEKETARTAPSNTVPPNTALPEPAKAPEVTVGGGRNDGPPVVELSAPPAYKPPSADVDDVWSYFLQAGAFRGRIDAENMRAKLALQGVEARITELQSENGLLYRVRIGPFAQLEAMNRVRSKLSDNGIDAAVVRVAK